MEDIHKVDPVPSARAGAKVLTFHKSKIAFTSSSVRCSHKGVLLNLDGRLPARLGDRFSSSFHVPEAFASVSSSNCRKGFNSGSADVLAMLS